MLSAAARGASSFSPRSMKPNWRAPAFRYSGTWPGHRRASHRGQAARLHADGLRLLLGLHGLPKGARRFKRAACGVLCGPSCRPRSGAGCRPHQVEADGHGRPGLCRLLAGVQQGPVVLYALIPRHPAHACALVHMHVHPAQMLHGQVCLCDQPVCSVLFTPQPHHHREKGTALP
jgi:hypothetical protein